jgi:hypothetical protein
MDILAQALLLLRDKHELDAKRVFEKLSELDVVLTEAVIMIGVAKSILRRGDDLTLNSLKAEVASNDPAGFIEDVMNQLLQHPVMEQQLLEQCLQRL